jgi:predicted DNA-binding protein
MAKKEHKPRSGRPRVLSEEVQTVAVRLPKALYMRLKNQVLREQIDTETPVTMSDVVRRAIEKELS